MKRMLLLMSIIACFLPCSSIYAQSNNEYGVEIKNVSTTSDAAYQYITGIATNNSPTTYSMFIIQYDLLDSEGDVVGNTSDVIYNFRPGQRWKFKMVVMEESATRFKYSNMEGI